MFGLLENHQNLYSWFPKITKTTFNVSVVHFLLMFGYKIFSLYYPLFLLSIGMSVTNIGGIYLLTYSTIAIGSLVINYYIRRFNPAKIAAAGICGFRNYLLNFFRFDPWRNLPRVFRSIFARPIFFAGRNYRIHLNIGNCLFAVFNSDYQNNRKV